MGLIQEAERGLFRLPDFYDLPAKKPDEPIFSADLSQTEFACLKLLSQGGSSRKIAEDLKISHRTVENYIAHMKSKWGCSKMTELIYQGVKRGVI